MRHCFFLHCNQQCTTRPGTRSSFAVVVLTWMTLVPNAAFAVDCAPYTYQDIEVIACRVDLREQRLRMFHLDETQRPLKYFSGVERFLEPRGERLVFAMNAGMYHSDFSAVGLLVSDGVELQPLNLADAVGNFFLKPNGVFLVTDSGAQILDSSRYRELRENVLVATQSGPLLVLDGTLHPAFDPDSASRFIRNGVGVLSAHEVVFVISEQAVTFYEFATLFRNGLGCKDALFLDASVSSLYSTSLQRRDVRAALGPIIGVTEPLASDASPAANR
jgi:uncharacterized protein YigE (DUF2233 family)